MKIYQYAVMLHPTENEKKSGKTSVIIVPVTSVVANSDQAATLLAAREIPVEHADKLDRIELAIRPF